MFLNISLSLCAEFHMNYLDLRGNASFDLFYSVRMALQVINFRELTEVFFSVLSMKRYECFRLFVFLSHIYILTQAHDNPHRCREFPRLPLKIQL